MFTIENSSQDIGTIGENGVAIGYGNFARGEVKAQSDYPVEWQQLYMSENWLKVDPVVRIGSRTPGISNWSEKDMVCPIFQAAACDLGLDKGTIVSHEIDGHKCLLGLAHSSPISPSAVRAAEYAVRKLHFRHLCTRAQTLSTSQKELIYLFANGQKAKQVAAHFGVSEDAVKQRKKIIQRIVGVNSFISTVSICSSAGLTIHPIS